MGGFHVIYCFDFYAQQPDFFGGKNWSCQWENLENQLLKQITKLPNQKKSLLLLIYR